MTISDGYSKGMGVEKSENEASEDDSDISSGEKESYATDKAQMSTDKDQEEVVSSDVQSPESAQTGAKST